jgi:hypothetical protein
MFDLAGSQHYPAVVVFPSIRDEHALLQQLRRRGGPASTERARCSESWATAASIIER